MCWQHPSGWGPSGPEVAAPTFMPSGSAAEPPACRPSEFGAAPKCRPNVLPPPPKNPHPRSPFMPGFAGGDTVMVSQQDFQQPVHFLKLGLHKLAGHTVAGRRIRQHLRVTKKGGDASRWVRVYLLKNGIPPPGGRSVDPTPLALPGPTSTATRRTFLPLFLLPTHPPTRTHTYGNTHGPGAGWR